MILHIPWPFGKRAESPQQPSASPSPAPAPPKPTESHLHGLEEHVREYVQEAADRIAGPWERMGAMPLTNQGGRIDSSKYAIYPGRMDESRDATAPLPENAFITTPADASAIAPVIGVNTTHGISFALPTAAPKETTMSDTTTAPNKFIGFLETVGKDFMKGLTWAVTYAVPVERLAALLFPTVAPEVTVAADAATLIQNAVISVEQKYAASGIQNGTGPQKCAEVLTLTSQAVTTLLTQAGIKADTTYIQSLISAVVAILNVQTPPTA